MGTVPFTLTVIKMTITLHFARHLCKLELPQNVRYGMQLNMSNLNIYSTQYVICLFSYYTYD